MNIDEDGFAKVGEIARQAVRDKVQSMLEPADLLNSADARQAVILGSFAAVVECFVCAADNGTTRDRLKEALRGCVDDFVDQAKDQLAAALQ